MPDSLLSWTKPLTTWLQNISQLRRVQLAASAIVSGSVVAGTIFAYQASSKRHRMRRLKLSIDPSLEDHDIIADLITKYHNHTLNSGQPAVKNISEEKLSEEVIHVAKRAAYDEDSTLEQLASTQAFLTPQGLSKLRAAFVVVIGLGGVGSHAAAALARSGISKLRLIDSDQVTLSSLNRHAVATLADVGTLKVDCMRLRLSQITPWVRFDCRNELFRQDAADVQLEPWEGQRPDFVVDATGNTDGKVELLSFCSNSGFRVVSAIGVGCKSDATRVSIGDISASIEDSLWRSVQRRLKTTGISKGISVVFSTEKAAPDKAQLLLQPEESFQKGKDNELGVLSDSIVKMLPVLGTMPAVYGLCVTNYIIFELAGYPHNYIPSKGREEKYDGILA